MPSGSRIILRTAAEADIPTPDASQVAFFANSDDSDAPTWKDDGGVFHSLQGADGALTYTNHGNTGASEDISFGTNVHRMVFNAATVALTASSYPASGTPGIVRLIIVQDGTGGRLADWSGISGLTWGAAGAPTLQTGAGAIDIIDLQTYDAGTTVYGSYEVGGTAYKPGGTDVALADGGTGASLADPGADRIMFWDDSGGAVTWLTAGTNLTITGTTIDASAGSGSPDCEEAYCSSATAIGTANTLTDITGLSMSLGAGDWEVEAECSVTESNTGSTAIGLAIHDGTSVVRTTITSRTSGSSGDRIQISCTARITLAGTATVKAQGISSRGSSSTTFMRDANGVFGVGSTNTASRIRAIKVTAI